MSQEMDFDTQMSLESALMDAKLMANVAETLILRAFGFDKAKVPPLDPHECELVNFVVTQTNNMISAADAIFQNTPSKKR